MAKRTLMDFFLAGAKDFGDDIKNTVGYMAGYGSRPKGPSMRNRKALIDEDEDDESDDVGTPIVKRKKRKNTIAAGE